MTKVTLTSPIKMLNGETEIDKDSSVAGTPLTTGSLLAKYLAASMEGDRIKQYEWAKKLYAGEMLDLDKSDYKYLYDFVKNHKAMNAMAVGQITENLDECEKQSKAKLEAVKN